MYDNEGRCNYRVQMTEIKNMVIWHQKYEKLQSVLNRKHNFGTTIDKGLTN